MHNTSLAQHKQLVGTIRIEHSAYEEIYDQLSEAYDDLDGVPGEAAVPACLMVIGETRAGKSCVVRDFMSRHLPKRTKEGVRQAVVYATAPSKGTVKALLEQLLKALGDPNWAHGSESNMTKRLLKLLKGVGCRMIILDEFQHLADKGQKRRLSGTADWLKELVEGKEWALVAVGLHESVAVINANRQLVSRFDVPLVMPIFDWRDNHSRRQFKGVLVAFAKQLTPFELPGLGSNEMALRMYLATSGRMGLFVKLMDRAVKTAIRVGTTKIRLEDLDAAFRRAIWYAPDFPLKDGPFFSDILLCEADGVLDGVAAIGAQDSYGDVSGTVVVEVPSTKPVVGKTAAKGGGNASKRRLREELERAL